MAYSAASGRRLWANRYHGLATGVARGTAVTVSPDSRIVYVTGWAEEGVDYLDYLTVAYDAATGREIWAELYDGPGQGGDEAYAIAVSPRGNEVFVTGASLGILNDDYATVAYDAATGAQLWVSRYNGPGNGTDTASALAVGPGGNDVFVTGTSDRTGTGQPEYATVAYDAATGTQLWVSRYSGTANGPNGATTLAVSRSGKRVFVTGGSAARGSHGDYATIAYNAATGARLWVSRYDGPVGGQDSAQALAVSPLGNAVFVTGASTGRSSSGDYATVAYSAATGDQLWVRRYDSRVRQGGGASSIGVSPTGRVIYVTGTTDETQSGYECATVAYRSDTGAQLWARRYPGPHDICSASSLGINPRTGAVYITGFSFGGKGIEGGAYLTIAYAGG